MSLFGSDKTETFTQVSNFQNNASAQADLSGAAGVASLNVIPTALGGSLTGPITTTLYNAPINLTALTSAGDSAVAAAADVAKSQIAAASPQGGGWSSLFSGSNLIWWLAAIVIFMIARKHHL